MNAVKDTGAVLVFTASHGQGPGDRTWQPQGGSTARYASVSVMAVRP